MFLNTLKTKIYIFKRSVRFKLLKNAEEHHKIVKIYFISKLPYRKKPRNTGIVKTEP